MNPKSTKIKNALYGAIALSALAIASPAAATISLALDPTITPVVGGGSDWTYSASFINSFTQSNESRIAIFDFDGYVPGFEVTPEGWVFTTAAMGPAPLADAAALAVPSHVDSSLTNLIWNFTGISGLALNSSVLEFGARSIYSEATQRSYGTRDRANSGTAETNSASQGPVYTPTTSAVPDQAPSMLMTSSLGLLLLGWARFRNKKAAPKQALA